MKNARRFLVAPCIARLISRDRGVDRQIVEGHLSSQPGKDQFIRFEAEQCHFVLSEYDQAGDLVEKAAPLPREHAEALFGICLGQISYDRLHLPPGNGLNQRMQLDRVVYPSCVDLITVEFDHAQQAEVFEVPTWLGPEVTTEYIYQWRYIALNGLQSDLQVPLTSRQVESVLDMLDQAEKVTQANNKSAEEVVVALSRSLETSGLLKTPKEAAISMVMEPAADAVGESTKRSAQ